MGREKRGNRVNPSAFFVSNLYKLHAEKIEIGGIEPNAPRAVLLSAV